MRKIIFVLISLALLYFFVWPQRERLARYLPDPVAQMIIGSPPASSISGAVTAPAGEPAPALTGPETGPIAQPPAVEAPTGETGSAWKQAVTKADNFSKGAGDVSQAVVKLGSEVTTPVREGAPKLWGVISFIFSLLLLFLAVKYGLPLILGTLGKTGEEIGAATSTWNWLRIVTSLGVVGYVFSSLSNPTEIVASAQSVAQVDAGSVPAVFRIISSLLPVSIKLAFAAMFFVIWDWISRGYDGWPFHPSMAIFGRLVLRLALATGYLAIAGASYLIDQITDLLPASAIWSTVAAAGDWIGTGIAALNPVDVFVPVFLIFLFRWSR